MSWKSYPRYVPAVFKLRVGSSQSDKYTKYRSTSRKRRDWKFTLISFGEQPTEKIWKSLRFLLQVPKKCHYSLFSHFRCTLAISSSIYKDHQLKKFNAFLTHLSYRCFIMCFLNTFLSKFQMCPVSSVQCCVGEESWRCRAVGSSSAELQKEQKTTNRPENFFGRFWQLNFNFRV